MNAIEQASLAQIKAAFPENSTWVSANAGSGKTRVLTNRVARLLLAGCEPQKILCLTYTNAAAAEMQNRLFESLGKWAMMPDDKLRVELESLGEKECTTGHLKMARTLFARALETPGGLKIQTIHSFCSAILRRFPLEAGMSPRFQEMEERQASQIRAEIVEEIAEKSQHIFDAVAMELSGDDLEPLMAGILRYRSLFKTEFDEKRVAKTLGADPDLDDEKILATVMDGVSDADIERLAAAMAKGGANDSKFAARVVNGAGVSAGKALDLYETLYLNSEGKERSSRGFPVKEVKDANPWVSEMMDTLKSRMADARNKRLSLKALHRARVLHGFTTEFLHRYDQRKLALGRVDYEDLIQKTLQLLSKSNMAAWVLYRLDGGIEHILVDEAQDTSPTQWEIIRIISEEFHSGQDERQTERSIFVVGDEKQSIYSFQGADPGAFGKMRRYFEDRLKGIGKELFRSDLLYSFRSAQPVLALVDKVFSTDAREGLEGEILHRAVKDELPGLVELWPFVTKPEKPDLQPWDVPVDSSAPNEPHLILANAIAMRIAETIKRKQLMPGTDRAITAGDFLILVQSRNKLFHAIIKSLKNHGVEVAGADRLKIIEELAVSDLLALLQFLATPEDDLLLAATLRSPLFGLSEADIYKIANDRNGTLWQSLHMHKNDWPQLVETLDDLLSNSDYERPYDLLEMILTKHDGRRKLVARLGEEAEDGIDELLNQSLNYESVEAPGLTGFLGWITSDEVEVKRQMDAAGDRVRVMTVHGAKGLESKIVILPDTAKRKLESQTPAVVEMAGSAVWKTSQNMLPDTVKLAEEARKKLVREENRRLLYVALTRAENWLIVCGGGDLDKEGESWFQRVEAAMVENGAETKPAPDGLEGNMLAIAHNWSDECVETKAKSDERLTLPELFKTPISQPDRPTPLISPSTLEGAHSLAGGDPEMEKAALDRGNNIHLLLEILSQIAKQDRASKAAEIIDSDDLPELLAEVSAILDEESLAFVFAENSLAEVPVTAYVDALSGRILGRIDRLIINDDEVVAIDFKSNREIPEKPEDTPEAILRQMGAYREALAQIYPDRRIKMAIIWTARAQLMELDEKIITTALGSANAP